MDRRILLGLGAVVAAVVLFLVLRPEDGEDAASPERATTSTPRAAETETATAATIPEPEAEPERVQLTVRDGGVVGGVRRLQVERGRGVVLVVRADVEDEVHVHGYDLLRPVGPGAPARLAFHARAPGVFEIELEDRHLLLAELEVRP